MTRWVLVLGFLGAISGCGSSGGSATCAASVPASCPTSPPSYRTEVAPVIQTYCVSCHAAGGQEADRPLDSQATLAALSADVESAVAGCSMPPSGDTQPTTAERETLLNWVVCGAQDN